MAETRFHSVLKARVKELMDNRAASLGRGAANNYDDYRYTVGYIIGLEDCLKICEDIEREFDA